MGSEFVQKSVQLAIGREDHKGGASRGKVFGQSFRESCRHILAAEGSVQPVFGFPPKEGWIEQYGVKTLSLNRPKEVSLTDLDAILQLVEVCVDTGTASGVRVEVVAFARSSSLEMRSLADRYIELGAVIGQVV